MSDATGRRIRFAPILTAIVLTVLLLWLVVKTSHILILLFLAILLSLYLGAVADLSVKRLRVSRHMGILIGIAASAGAVTGLVMLLVPPVVQQTQTLISLFPTYLSGWEEGLQRLAERYPAVKESLPPGDHQILHVLYTQVSGAFHDVVPKVLYGVHGAISTFAVLIMALYLALYPGLYREWLIVLFPPVHRDLARDTLRGIADTLRAWIVGQMIAMLALAMLTALGLYLLDVPFWLPFGLFTGAVAIVPFFGTLLSTLVPALFVLGGDGFHGLGPGVHATLVILLGIVVHVFEGNVIVPLVTARQVELPPVLTIMSVLVVGDLLGPLGLIIAVPLLATLMVVVRRILVNRVYEGQGFRRATRDRVLVLRVPATEGGVLVAHASAFDPIAFVERSGTRKTA